MNLESMTPLEEKQIKGLTAKSIWWLVSSTAVVVATVLLSVNGINESINQVNSQLQLLQRDRENDRTFYEYKFNELNQKYNYQQGILNEQQRRIDELQKESLKRF